MAEGVRIRELGVEKPVIVFSPLPPDSYQDAVRAGLSVPVGDLQSLSALREAAVKAGSSAGFHLEVDTGMGRAGFPWNKADAWVTRVAALFGDPLRWDGCFTHFHTADAPGDATGTQWNRLQELLARLPAMPPAAILHACNSPGALRRPDLAADAVRPGIFLYGGVAGEGIPSPHQVASLRARITLIRDAREGDTVGYGATHQAQRPERWATVGIGYGDGLPRLLGNRGHALVGGKRVPIIGRISMDVTVLDITGLRDVQVGDVVTFFGEDGGGRIPLEEVASQAETINYEVLTDLTPRVPRIWTDDGGY